MLIDRTYFVGEINIPNVSQPAIGSLVDLFITKYEPEFLQAALGYELAKAFATGIEATTPDQKWIDLRDGIEYTACGSIRKWQGLITAVPKESLIANYIYYWYSRNQHTQSTTMGEVKTTTENAVLTSPAEKMCRAWNEMSKWLCDLIEFLNARVDTYPEWKKQDQWRLRNTFRSINVFNI